MKNVFVVLKAFTNIDNPDKVNRMVEAVSPCILFISIAESKNRRLAKMLFKESELFVMNVRFFDDGLKQNAQHQAYQQFYNSYHAVRF